MKKSSWTDPGSKNRARSDAAEEHEDPLNPAIPKAPLIPHDIARMPNAALPVWSHPPDEQRGGERPTLSVGADTLEVRGHVDARPPPGATPSTYQSAAMPPHSDSLPRMERVQASSLRAPPSAETVSPPAVSPRPTALERESRGQVGRTRWSIVLVILAIVMTLAGLWLSGALK